MPVQTATKPMIMEDIRVKAKGLGINAGKMKREELIRMIQTAEGYTPCYKYGGTKSDGPCPYTDCCFRPDCLKTRI
jgi:hypothetical protein